MGGERPAEGNDKPKPKAPEGISLIQAIGEDQRDDTRNRYPTSVAPAFDGQHKADPYYQPRPGQKPSRATYGGGVVDPITGRPVETPAAPQQPPDFAQAHPEAANRDPRQRYAPSDVGRAVAGQQGAPGQRLVQLGDEDKKQDQFIGRRGLVGDPAVDPDARGMRGLQLKAVDAGVAGLSGVASSYIKSGLDKSAASTVERHAATAATEGTFTKMRLAPARAWNNYIAGEGRLEPIITADAANQKVRADLIAKQDAILENAATKESERVLAKQRLEALTGGLKPEVATNTALWGEDAAAVQRMYLAEQKVAKQATSLADTGITASASKRFGNGIAQTLMVQGGISLDRYLANAQKPGGAEHSTGYQQFLAPAAIAYGEKLPGKLGWLAAATATSRVLETFLPNAPDAIRTPINMTDWKDMGVLATTLTIAQSVKNPIARVGLVTAGVVGTKLWHGVEDNWPGNLKSEVYTARDGLKRDAHERSESSINNMTDNYRSLAGKKEDYVFALVEEGRAVMRREWNRTDDKGQPTLSTEQKLNAYRQDAAMSRGLAEETLKQGTRIIGPGKAEYVAKGYDLDLNGTATDLLLTAGRSTRGAAFMTQRVIDNNGDSSKPKILIDGAEPKPSEVEGLNRYDADTQKKINEIFDGKHDIKGAVGELAKYVGSDSNMNLQKSIINECDRKAIDYAKKGQQAKDAMDKAAQEGNEKVRQMAEKDMQEAQRMIAKLYRDEAVVMLAMAKNKMDHGQDGGGAQGDLIDDPQLRGRNILPNGKTKSFNGAQGAIAMAIRFGGDANHPDVQQLLKLYGDMVDKLPDMIRKNYANPHLNPNNVDNGLYAQ